MRVIKFLTTTLVVLAVLAVGGFFLARGILLHWGSSSVIQSIGELQRARTSGSFASQCASKFLGESGYSESPEYQLRFLSSREYVLELDCSSLTFDTVLISRKELPMFISKTAGSSGILLSSNTTAIELQVFRSVITQAERLLQLDLSNLNKSVVIAVEHDSVVKNPDYNYFSDGPVTSCQGYGFQCCDTASQVGEGQQITGSLDCEKSCFNQCVPRPIVLSFNSVPSFNIDERTVEITPGQNVQFQFVGESANDANLKGIINFGDGQSETINSDAGDVRHTYACPSARCEYTAQLTLEDTWGVKSADLHISKIKVVVAQ